MAVVSGGEWMLKGCAAVVLYKTTLLIIPATNEAGLARIETPHASCFCSSFMPFSFYSICN